MREAYRLQKNALKSALENKENSALLFFIFTGKELVPFKTIFSQAGKALAEIEKRISSGKI